MADLREFKAGLDAYLAKDAYARPFVCEGSPLDCRSFIVGLNAATRLSTRFSCYWSDSVGFDRGKFECDYRKMRPQTGRGNRPRIEVIAKEIAPCLETNLYAIPTSKAVQLTEENRRNPVICYLFRIIKPELVFVHSNEPIHFFEEKTGCSGFTGEAKRVRWQGHDFWLCGLPRALYTLRIQDAADLGAKLATNLGR